MSHILIHLDADGRDEAVCGAPASLGAPLGLSSDPDAVTCQACLGSVCGNEYCSSGGSLRPRHNYIKGAPRCPLCVARDQYLDAAEAAENIRLGDRGYWR